jgi:predicted nucleotidyltransferase
MSSYPKAVIDRFVSLCQRRISDHVLAIASVGSYSRGDFMPEKSDVDLLLVLKNNTTCDRRIYIEVAKICQEVDPSKELLKDVFIYTNDELSSPYLVSVMTYLWLYDAKVNGKVVYGNNSILEQIKIPEEIDRELCKKILLWSKLLLKNLGYPPRSPEMITKVVSFALLNYATCLVAIKSGEVVFSREQLAETCKRLFKTDLIFQAVKNKHVDKISKDEAERFHESAVSFVVEAFKDLELS